MLVNSNIAAHGVSLNIQTFSVVASFFIWCRQNCWKWHAIFAKQSLWVLSTFWRIVFFLIPLCSMNSIHTFCFAFIARYEIYTLHCHNRSIESVEFQSERYGPKLRHISVKYIVSAVIWVAIVAALVLIESSLWPQRHTWTNTQNTKLIASMQSSIFHSKARSNLLLFVRIKRTGNNLYGLMKLKIMLPTTAMACKYILLYIV